MSAYIGEWSRLRARAVQSIDDATLRAMRVKILPAAIQQKLRDRVDLTLLKDCIQFAQQEVA